MLDSVLPQLFSTITSLFEWLSGEEILHKTISGVLELIAVSIENNIPVSSSISEMGRGVRFFLNSYLLVGGCWSLDTSQYNESAAMLR